MKTLITLLLACCFGSAAAWESQCWGDQKTWNRCHVANHPYYRESGGFVGRYSGAVMGGRPHGQGVLILPNRQGSTDLESNGGMYIGYFENGLYEGFGIQYNASGIAEKKGVYEKGKLIRLDTVWLSMFYRLADQPAIYWAASRSKDENAPNSAQPGKTEEQAMVPSNLPPCAGPVFSWQDNPPTWWTDCYAEFTAYDSTYSGEWRDGKHHGKGKDISKKWDFSFEGTYSNGRRWTGRGISSGKEIGFVEGDIVKDVIWKNAEIFSGTRSTLKGKEWVVVGSYVAGVFYPVGSAPKASTQVTTQDTSEEQAKQKQAEFEAQRKATELALAEAEQAKRKQAELEAQLAAVQQAQVKPTVSAVTQGKRVALVIGNAKYKFNPLNNPVNDATDMAASLRSVGFDVIEVKDATLKQMRAATRQFADKLEVSDVGLVYYSGHGIEVKGKNYLIPVNADIRREYEVVDQAFDASNLLRMMESLQSGTKKRVNILIVDACRNNDLPKSWRSTNNGLARMDAPAGSFISFATAPGQVAADGQGRNSPYTKHLLQALKQPNVPIEQVFKQVRRKVMAETSGEQVPWENSSLVGDFYFTVAR